MKQAKILVIGSSNTDMVIKSNRLPQPRETIIGGNFVLAAGGKGANQAVAAARIGGNVTFIAKVGTDMFGDQAIENYRREGIDTSRILRTSEHATGVALILVDDRGENMISVASGANEFLSPKDVEKAESVIAEAGVVVTQLETPVDTLLATTRLCRKHGVPLVLDPAPAPQTALPDEIFLGLACIKPNEVEAEQLTGIKVTDVYSAQKAADVLLHKGVKAALITLGAQGSLLVETPGRGTTVAAYPVKAVDSTAAGDAFSGALAYGISQGRSLLESAQTASVYAALSVTRLGAQPSLPTKMELEEFLTSINFYQKVG